MMRLLVVPLLALPLAVLAQTPAGKAGRPDLSGYWGAGRAATPDPARVAALPPNTVVLKDAGATEFPLGEFGGLRVKPAALDAAKRWKPQDDMTISRACLPPSIVYTMQGPFPMEIYQATELIVFKLEYFDLVRIVFMDGRPHPGPEAPHSKVGHSVGRWEGSTLVVDTTHLSESTITNNGLNHSDQVRVTERFWLSADGRTLLGLQEFEDPAVLDDRGARFMAWDRMPGEHVLPYECDPSFGENYRK
jgi:hypothetical protein